MSDDDDFIVAALWRLVQADGHGTPIVYLHPTEDSAPAGVLVTARVFAAILDLVPEGDEITRIVMAHDHLTP